MRHALAKASWNLYHLWFYDTVYDTIRCTIRCALTLLFLSTAGVGFGSRLERGGMQEQSGLLILAWVENYVWTIGMVVS